MAKEVRLPQLGQTMEEGTIVNCLIKAGDEVKKGDVIFEIETDKATLEMESPADGFVKNILVEVDQTLAVGEPLLVLGDKDEEVPQSFIDSLKDGAPAAPSEPAPVEQAAPAAPQPAAPAGRVIASPRAKKLAGELGVDLAAVAGTGPAGKITEQDVQQAAASKSAKPADPAPVAQAQADVKLGATVPLNRLQKITAERMLKSKREIPCFYLTVRADVTCLVDLRTELNQTSDVKVSYNDFIIKAVATGLEKYPIMTGQLAGESIKLAEAINIGLAISVPDGLVAPILKDVNKKDVKQIARDTKAIVERARSNKLAPTDVEGGCITVSNLGAFGIDNFIPIVVPGQCSILGVGQITDTCVPDNGNIMVRKLMNMTLSVDHKVANGAVAAQFLDFVRKLLEDTSTFDVGN
ncbi:MAG: 2-oxo acid dehydrogenase subunit E2 [Planctomycetes bacterium]|nr:2-oxo acid dehydrogenase subunit E2 [Planctomycetota bacterium]MBL7142934.1 2-oxo acid dehydrogenase subunit E2 [Phycisphaerae bacterium]